MVPGGHTAGLTGKKVAGGKVQTIVGLDPAGERKRFDRKLRK